ncbi:MAG: hypothetical protein ACOYD9_02575 [Pyramidobacter sp.]
MSLLGLDRKYLLNQTSIDEVTSMSGPYQDPTSGQYYESQQEALYQQRMHQEFFIAANDEAQARRARQQMEYERMEQERQRTHEERAWKQYQARLEEQKRREQWLRLSPEQQWKSIVDRAKCWNLYEAPSKLWTASWGCFFTVILVTIFLKYTDKLGTIGGIMWALAFLGVESFFLNSLTKAHEEEKKQLKILDKMKEVARRTQNKTLHVEFAKPFEFDKLNEDTEKLWRYMYVAAKYGFEVDNPELQEFYKKNREELVRRKDTRDIDWESLWNEKPKETVA